MLYINAIYKCYMHIYPRSSTLPIIVTRISRLASLSISIFRCNDMGSNLFRVNQILHAVDLLSLSYLA